jgi:DNA-3-methyladenine glycosylase II
MTSVRETLRLPAASSRRLQRASLLSAVRHLGRSDPRLGRLVARYGPPPLWARRPGYASLLRIILEQQVSLASARALYRRLELRLGRVEPAGVLAFGTTGLQGLGFTRQKAGYACGVAEAIVSERLLLRSLGRCDDEAAAARLVALRGVGPWTAAIYLLMALRRPDVWPPGDLALHKALARLSGADRLPTSDEAARIADRWRPYRAVAARILWHGYLSDRPA